MEITVFSIWHGGYLLILVATVVAGVLFLGRSASKTRRVALRAAAWAVPLLYAADFFLMPLVSADRLIDVGKLPFHICTLMGLLIPFAQFHHRGDRVLDAVAALSLVCSLCFLIYPGSAVGFGRHPLSYSVVQTFAYHGSMLAWSVWTLLYGEVRLRLARLWKPGVMLALITLWAALANRLYSHDDVQFDWLFITGYSIPFLPSHLLIFLVPFVIFMGVVIVYALFTLIETEKSRKKSYYF